MFPLLSDSDVARGPMIAADHLARLIKQPLDRICKHGRLLAEGLLVAEELYNPDFLIVFSDIAVEAEALGVGLEFSPERNPHIIRHLDPDQVGLINMPACGRLPELFHAAEICRQALDPHFPIFFSMKDPFSLAALVMGSEAFLTALLKAPEVVRRLLDICTDNQLGTIEAICTSGYIPLVGAPIASGSLIGPRWFREFAQPCLETIYNRIREMGSFCCLHICGEVAPLREQLPQLNLDLLSFEEWCAPMWKKMPGTIPMGYVPTDLFARGSESDVRRAACDCLANMPRSCILSTACDLPANADPHLVKCMI